MELVMARKKKSPEIICRFCGDACPNERDALSHWSHHHPSVCPYRTDKVPVMNGVHVGDLWQNRHTGTIERIEECRLGGDGVYTDREPCYVTATVWEQGNEGELELEPPDFDALATVEPIRTWFHDEPMWGLVEKSDPLTRPGEYPVPWHIETRDRGGEFRTANEGWRTPAYRRIEPCTLDDVVEWPGRDKRERWTARCTCGHQTSWQPTRAKAKAAYEQHLDRRHEHDEHATYWHSFHTVHGYGIQWEKTNVIWQVDPQLELEIEQRKNALAGAAALLDDPLLGKTAASLVAAFSEEE